MQYRNDHICRGPKGRDRCGRFRCPSLVHPLPSPLGVRAPGKMSGGHFPVRTGRLGPWEVDRRRRAGRGRFRCLMLVGPCLPLWGRWQRGALTKEVPGRSPLKGGLSARTIERAWLAAMWTAGEVPGSTGKPPKICVPRLPERRDAFQTKPFNRKAIPQSGRKNLSYSPCRSSRWSIMISIIFRSE